MAISDATKARTHTLRSTDYCLIRFFSTSPRNKLHHQSSKITFTLGWFISDPSVYRSILYSLPLVCMTTFTLKSISIGTESDNRIGWCARASAYASSRTQHSIEIKFLVWFFSFGSYASYKLNVIIELRQNIAHKTSKYTCNPASNFMLHQQIIMIGRWRISSDETLSLKNSRQINRTEWLRKKN